MYSPVLVFPPLLWGSPCRGRTLPFGLSVPWGAPPHPSAAESRARQNFVFLITLESAEPVPSRVQSA